MKKLTYIQIVDSFAKSIALLLEFAILVSIWGSLRRIFLGFYVSFWVLVFVFDIVSLDDARVKNSVFATQTFLILFMSIIMGFGCHLLKSNLSITQNIIVYSFPLLIFLLFSMRAHDNAVSQINHK